MSLWRHLLASTVVLGFIGGFIVLGGLASLQADTPGEINDTVKPYRFCWFVWTFEVFILLYGAFSIHVDYTKLRTSFLALVAINNTFVINLINAHIYQTASLPGSNGSATRGNVTIAGLIIVAISNFLFILFTGGHDLSQKTNNIQSADIKDTPSEIDDTVKPYRFVWFIWSFEVAILLFAVVALLVDYRRLKTALLTFVAINTVLVIDLINAHIYGTSSLPGSKGEATRGNIAIAGLIIIAVAHGFLIIFTGLFDLMDKSRAHAPGSPEGKGMDV
ncbi:hypothetical protein N2152v2_004597 [Parachlorella kessleri]